MARKVTRRQARSFYVGVLLVVIAGVIGYVSLTAHEGLPGEPSTVVRASFDDIGTLKPGSEVRQNSARIGQVSSIELVDGKPVVKMDLDGNRTIYRNARAAIWDQSALSQKFVELMPGDRSAPPLGDTVIRPRATTSSVDLDQVLDVLDRRTRDATTSAIRQLGGGVAGHSRAIHDFLKRSPDLLNDTGTVSAALASKEANLPAVLASANQLAGRFEGRQRDIGSLVNRLNETLEAVTVDGAKPLADTLEGAPEAIRHGTRAADSLRGPLANLRNAVTHLHPGGRALGQATSDFRGVLRESVGPLKRIPGVSEQATPAVEELTRTSRDLRPLAPRLTEGLGHVRSLLEELKPYAPEIGQFGADGGLLFAGHAGEKHWLRGGAVVPGLDTATRTLPALNGLTPIPREAYPEPGEAVRMKAQTPLLVPGRK